jgi:hypothetical protein
MIVVVLDILRHGWPVGMHLAHRLKLPLRTARIDGHMASVDLLVLAKSRGRQAILPMN